MPRSTLLSPGRHDSVSGGRHKAVTLTTIEQRRVVWTGTGAITRDEAIAAVDRQVAEGVCTYFARRARRGRQPPESWLRRTRTP